MVKYGFLLVVILSFCAIEGRSQEIGTEIINPIGMYKSIESDAKDRFANPSDAGTPAGDLNGDGELDFIHRLETWRDMRGFTNGFMIVTTFVSYNEQGETSKASYVDGAYFPIGDLNNDGKTEVIKTNNSGQLFIHTITSNDTEDFVLSEIGIEVPNDQGYVFLNYTMPGFFNEDEFGDVLLCENTFNSFDDCMILFGNDDDSNSYESIEFSFEKLGINFFYNPRIFVTNSISGTGLGIYAIGDDSNSRSMLYEFGTGDSNKVGIAFEYEWEGTSFELSSERRYFIDDFDGDEELEILSSDDRVFSLSGLQRIYFSTPICDVRDIDYTGETPEVQSPQVISSNCLVDRVIQPDTTQTASAKMIANNETNEPSAYIWEKGNYYSCSGSNLYSGCDGSIYVTDDQTTLPCSYNSCSSSYYYYDYNDYPYYYNGYADPLTANRGLQQYVIAGGNGIAAATRSVIAEVARLAYIISNTIVNPFATQQPQIESVYRSGDTYTSYYHTCDQTSSSSCQNYTIQKQYYHYLKSLIPNSSVPLNTYQYSSRYYSNQTYTHYTVALTPEDENHRYVYMYYDVDENDRTSDKRVINLQTKQDIPTDTLLVTGTIDTSPFPDLDINSSPFILQNVGDIDGHEGEELLIGSNRARSGNNTIEQAWLYVGTNQTHEQPDAVIEFRNDSTINEFAFLDVGRVASNLGDVNGDGINDFGIGLVDYNRTSNSSGGVYVFAGRDFSQVDTIKTPLTILEPIVSEEHTVYAFGSQIAGGDFDGDGYSDIAVLADQSYGGNGLPTIRVYKGGENMDSELDYELFVTPKDVGGFGTDTLKSFFDAVIAFMPKNEGEDHQDLYFSPGGFSNYPDAVIFQGGISAKAKRKGINSPASTPRYTLAEAGATATGSGTFDRKKPAAADVNDDGFYDLYIVKQYDNRDAVSSSRVLMFSPNSGIEVSEELLAENPLDYKLSQNYPNPFNPSTTIEFRLGKAVNVSLKVYDILGREVANLITNQLYNEGSHSIHFDASTLASGLYLYRLEAGGFIQTRKMMLVK
jgi:hypothetical protein